MISFNRLLKSGMTLTQIYSQYVSISEQMLFEEEENEKLNNYIDHSSGKEIQFFLCV